MRQEAAIGLMILLGAFGWILLIGLTDLLMKAAVRGYHRWKEWNT